MKEITVVMGMILAMLVIMVFPCWGEDVIYYGSYRKNNGDLRIVDNPNECRRSEVPIYWNQIGPQGVPGHSPVLTWSGDQIAIDSVVSGPHLTGPQGPQGPPGGIDRSASVIQKCNNIDYCQCPPNRILLTYSASCPDIAPPSGYYLSSTELSCHESDPAGHSITISCSAAPFYEGSTVYPIGVSAWCTHQYVSLAVNIAEDVFPDRITLICY